VSPAPHGSACFFLPLMVQPVFPAPHGSACFFLPLMVQPVFSFSPHELRKSILVSPASHGSANKNSKEPQWWLTYGCIVKTGSTVLTVKELKECMLQRLVGGSNLHRTLNLNTCKRPAALPCTGHTQR
jgi:hypothetical protein